MTRRLEGILTREDLSKILKKNMVTIIKASATWCGPCKKIEEQVEELFDKTSNNVQMVYVDVDVAIDLSTYLRIRKLPTFLSFVGLDKMDIYEGSKIDLVTTFFKKSELRAKLLGTI